MAIQWAIEIIPSYLTSNQLFKYLFFFFILRIRYVLINIKIIQIKKIPACHFSTFHFASPYCIIIYYVSLLKRFSGGAGSSLLHVVKKLCTLKFLSRLISNLSSFSRYVEITIVCYIL